MKKEQNKNEYKPKNQFEALLINQFTNINNRLDNIEQDVSILKQDISELKQDVNKIKNTPTMKKELN